MAWPMPAEPPVTSTVLPVKSSSIIVSSLPLGVVCHHKGCRDMMHPMRDPRVAPGRLRLAVFDCDGTLVDSAHGILAAMAVAFEAHGLARPAEETVRRSVGLSLPVLIAALLPGHPP